MNRDKIQTNLLGKEVTLLKPRFGDQFYADERLPERFRGETAEIVNVYLDCGEVFYDVRLRNGLVLDRLTSLLFRVGKITEFDPITWTEDTPPCKVCGAKLAAGEQVVASNRVVPGRLLYIHIGCEDKT